jgi:heme exporter protein D
MYEGLNHWPFVAASYALTVLGTALLIGVSLLAMRKAEARRDRARDQ